LAQLQASAEALRSPPLPGQRLTWPALPGTGRELEQIQKLARGRLGADVLTGPQATTDAVKQKLAQVRYAHLATHGFFASREFRSALQWDEQLFVKVERAPGLEHRFAAGARSPLLLSGLVFAGANKAETPDKGILVADSIVGLDLHNLNLAV